MRGDLAYANHRESRFQESDARYSSAIKPRQIAPQRATKSQHVMDSSRILNERTPSVQSPGLNRANDSAVSNEARGLYRPHTHSQTTSGLESTLKEMRVSNNTASAYPMDDSYGFPFTPQRARSGTASAGTGQAPRLYVYQFFACRGISANSLRTPTRSREVLAAFLIPLPFLLLSLAFRLPFGTTSPTGSARPDVSYSVALILASALTASTLVAVAIIARYLPKDAAPDGRRGTLGEMNDFKQKLGPNKSEIGRRMLGRVLSVGLPLYSTLILGGTRVAVVLLISLATSLTGYDYAEGWSLLLSTRKATLAALFLGPVCDGLGLTANFTFTPLFLGYISLFISVFIFPLPLPTTQKSSSLTASQPPSASSTSTVPSTPWDQPPPAATPESRVHKSPLILTDEDASLTLETGGLLCILCFLAVLFGPHFSFNGPPITLALLSVATASFVGVLLFAQSFTLQTESKIGVALGLAFCTISHDISFTSSWLVTAVHSIISILSYIAVALDTKSPIKSIHQYTLYDEKSTLGREKAAHKHKKHSRFTGFLLKRFYNWPLVYSILAEKDSRRILYFMRYVAWIF